ncbi:hypothetical protein HN385_00920 [archaeon]|nr:hypothetical protein [archaeon]MBT3450630.1 hypothetical protein [archaeon]MBT6868684.1 hypothetical protein [archaeon]MBT7193472.1 hypothetical protein [archaeon]MBT7381063.1 hypothetical protein [archaeon]
MNQLEDLQVKGQDVFLKYMLDESKRKKYYLDWKNDLPVLLNFQCKIDEFNLSDISDNELKNIWNKFYDLTIKFWVNVIFPELANYGSEKYFKEKLSHYILKEDDLRTAMEILTTPKRSSFFEKEEVELLGTYDFKKHQEKYFWLQNSYFGSKICSIDFFKERKKNLNVNLKTEIEQRIFLTRENKTKIIETYNLPKKIINISNAISECIEWQDERKGHLLLNIHYKDILLNEVARRFDYDKKYLTNFAFFEISKLFEGVDLKQEAELRKECMGIHFTDEINVLNNKEALEFWEEFVDKEVKEHLSEFKGTIASKGPNQITKGKVRVILDPFNIKHFNQGEILVTSMTSPEFVFIMKKASAIITDTGGLTCHAAILSREMKVPCIVGTKIATQVLKDGDLIEVDTRKGTVKKNNVLNQLI